MSSKRSLIPSFILMGICVLSIKAQMTLDDFRNMKIYIGYEGSDSRGISGFINNQNDRDNCKSAISIALKMYQSVIPQMNFTFVENEYEASDIFFFANFNNKDYRLAKTGYDGVFGGYAPDHRIYINDGGYEFDNSLSPINFSRFTYMGRDRMLNSYVPCQLPIQRLGQISSADRHTFTATDPISANSTNGASDLVRILYHEIAHWFGMSHPTSPTNLDVMNLYGQPNTTKAPYIYPNPVSYWDHAWLDYYMGGGDSRSPWPGAINKLSPIIHMTYPNIETTLRGSPNYGKFNNRYVQDFDREGIPFWNNYRVVYPELMQGIICMEKVDRSTTFLTRDWREAFKAGQMNTATQSDPFLMKTIFSKVKYQRFSGGYLHSAAIKADGTLWTWGYNYYGQVGNNTSGTNVTSPVQPSGTGADWVSVSCGGYHTVALKKDGTLWAWGNNSSGQLGDGTNTRRIVPTQVIRPSGLRWVSVAAGSNHTIALLNDGTIWTWGSNEFGQLGNMSTFGGQNATPTKVGTDKDWVQIDAGNASDNCAALKENGALYVWGYGLDGQIGNGWNNAYSPQIIISDYYGWASVSVGYRHIMAIKKDGTLCGWGRNDYGQIGNGNTSNYFYASQVGTANDWVYVEAGGQHTIGIRGNATNRGGTLWGWGRNNYKQLATGAPDPSPTPYRISSTTDWASVKLGFNNTMAVDTFGTVKVTGYNAYGQLGDGTMTDRATLTTIPWRINQAPVVTATNPQTGISFSAFTSPLASVNTLRPTWNWQSQSPVTPKNYRYRRDNSDMSGATATTRTTYTPSSNLTEGVHTLYVQEKDAMGSWSPVASFSVKADQTNPIVTLTQSTSNPYYTGYWLGAVANEPLKAMTYTTDGSEPTLASPAYTVPIDIINPTTIKVKAWDLAGRSSVVTKTVTFTGAHLESNNLMVFEAENFSRTYAWNTTIDPANARWKPASTITGFSGTGYVGTDDVDGQNGTSTSGCYLRYRIKAANFSGTSDYRNYNFWARIRAPKDASNSVILTSVLSFPLTKATATYNSWVWVHFGKGYFNRNQYANIYVVREKDGCLVDKIVLAADDAYTPTGTGPSVSAMEP